MNVFRLICNPFRECCYVLSDDNGTAAIIDCGCVSASEQQRLTRHIAENHLTPVAHLATHAHLDHLFGAAFIYRTYGLPTFVSAPDMPLVERLAEQATDFGYPWTDWSFPTEELEPLKLLELLKPLSAVRIMRTAGHTPGSVCFYLPDEKLLLSGDTLFCGGYGRTDLWGGDQAELIHSLAQLRKLPADTRVLPGHGYETTIGDELHV